MNQELLLKLLAEIRADAMLAQSELLNDHNVTQPRNLDKISELYKKFTDKIKQVMCTDEDDTDIEVEQDSRIKCIQMLPEGCKFVKIYPNDEIPKDLTVYKCNEDGSSWLVSRKSCLCCEHCTDVWLDWNGPYGFICDIGKDICAGCVCECSYFTSDDKEESNDD